MSENLKRAESLFNRIMNQNGSKPESSGTKSTPNGSHHHSINGNHHRSSHNHSQPHHSSHHQHSHGSRKPRTSRNNTPIDLPKRDPVKQAELTVSQLPMDHHILPYCWTLWHHLRKKKSSLDAQEEVLPVEDSAVDSYLQTTKELEFATLQGGNLVSSIGSLEQLWVSLSSLKKGYEMTVSTELLLFKSGIIPVWEDPINTKGGRWVFKFGHRNGTAGESEALIAKVRQRTSLIWERLILKTVSGSLFPPSEYTAEVQDILLNDISGIVLSIRKHEDIISVWNSNLNFSKESKVLSLFQARRVICDAILRVIRECDLILAGSPLSTTVDNSYTERVNGVSFDYRLHSESGQPPSSYNHSNRRYKKK